MKRTSDTLLATTGSTVFFMYTGETQLSIRGLVTGTLYVFLHQGAVVQVDPRDLNSLKAYPSLQLMSKYPE